MWFKTGFRLGAEGYIKVLKKTLIPWMRSVAAAHASPTGTHAPFIMQQNSAPAHRAAKTIAFLEEEGVDFWTPQQWPPNSPDLNPLDYSVWSMVSQEACRNRPKSVAAMKTIVSRKWNDLDPVKIRAVCRRFLPRLERCVAEKGGYFDLKIQN